MEISTSPSDINTRTVESEIDQYGDSHLPLFGHCTEIHSSNAPSLLPEPGEADEHERKLNAPPWER